MRKGIFNPRIVANDLSHLKRQKTKFQHSNDKFEWKVILQRVFDQSFNFNHTIPLFIPLRSKIRFMFKEKQSNATNSKPLFSLSRISNYENSVHKLKYALQRYRIMNEALHVRPQFLYELYSWKKMIDIYKTKLKCLLECEKSLFSASLLPWIDQSLQKQYSILTIPCGKLYILSSIIARLITYLIKKPHIHFTTWTSTQTRLVLYICLLLKTHSPKPINFNNERSRLKYSMTKPSIFHSMRSWDNIPNNLNLATLLCSFYGLSSFGFDSSCVNRLVKYHSLLKQEDKLIHLSSISDSLLRSLAHRRGIFPLLPIHVIRDRISKWINSPFQDHLSLLYQLHDLSKDIQVYIQRSSRFYPFIKPSYF